MTTGDSPARPLNMNGQVFVQGAPRMATIKSTDKERNEINAGETADTPGASRKASRSDGMSSPRTIGNSPDRPLNMNRQVSFSGAPREASIRTDQELEEIVGFLRHRMKSGSLSFGSIKEAAQHFGLDRRTIWRIWRRFNANTSV
jgi:hypothetical protein